MKDLIIVGAGGLGREVLQMCMEINMMAPTWNIKGFINDDLHALDGIDCRYSVIGTIRDWEPKEDEVFVFAIANPKAKEKLVEMMLKKGAKFETIISPRAFVADNAKIGEGVVISPFCFVSCNTVIGDFTFLNVHCAVGHDVVIGAYSSTMSYVDITGCCNLGRRTYWGSGSRIIPGTKVDNDAHIGAGSVVLRNIKTGISVFGNPAKKVEF